MSSALHRKRDTKRRRAPIGAWIAVAAILAPFSPQPGHAQVAASPPAASTPEAAVQTTPSTERLRALIGTLENDAERQKLIGQLKDLLAAQEAVAKPVEKGAGARAIAALSDRIEAISRSLVEGAAVVIDTPRLARWLQAQLSDPDTRATWFTIAWKVMLVVFAGIAAEWAARRLLARARGAVEAREAESVWVRTVYLLAWLVLDLAPLGAFAVTGYVILPLLDPGVTTRLVAVALVNAIVLARALVSLAQFLFMPRVPTLRVVPLNAEDATYCYVWVRRLVYVAIYGYVLAEAAQLLGIPPSGHEALVNLVGLVVALLLVVLVLQARPPVSRWLRGTSAAPVRARGWTMLRERLADIWHVLAIVYILGMYAVWAIELRNGFEYVGQASLLTVVILFAARLAAQAASEGLGRVFAISDDIKQRFPGIEARANRYLAVLQSVAVALVYLIAAFAVLTSWGVDSFAWLESEFGRRLAGRAILIAAVIAVTVLLWEVAISYIDGTMAREGAGRLGQRARTLLPLARSVALIVLIAIASLTVLSELGVDISPLLAGAGVVGLAVGFGSQTLVKDIVTGIFMLSENQIAVGDVVKAGDHAGLVEAITIRTLRLRDFDGTLYIVPFSAVTTVSNMTKDYSSYVFDVAVSYREDVDQVLAVLKAIGAEMQADPAFGHMITKPLETFGIERFEDSAVIVRARVTTLPVAQWDVGHEFNRRLKKRFDELGIEMASPRRTLYFGAPREGEAPAGRIRVVGDAAAKD